MLCRSSSRRSVSGRLHARGAALGGEGGGQGGRRWRRPSSSSSSASSASSCSHPGRSPEPGRPTPGGAAQAPSPWLRVESWLWVAFGAVLSLSLVVGELGIFSFLLPFSSFFFTSSFFSSLLPSFFPSFPPSSFPVLSGTVILKPARRLQGGHRKGQKKLLAPCL